MIAAAVYEVNRDTNKRSEPFGPADIFPWLKGSEREQTVEEQIAVVEHLTALFGGQDLRNQKG